MGLLDSLHTFRFGREIDAAARRLADALWPDLWQRVQLRALQLPPAEARGYVRAYAAAAARPAVDALVRRHRVLGDWARPLLEERVVEELMVRSLQESWRLRRQRVPASPVRRAA
jgi:hypothetical protein